MAKPESRAWLGRVRAFLGQRVADELAHAHRAGRAHRLEVGHDEPDQCAVHRQKRDLLDQRMAGIDGLHRFGEELLAVGEHDGLGDARGDVEIAGVIDVSEIAGAEPAIGGEGALVAAASSR